MNLQITENTIPGTILDRYAMGDVTGMEFLSKIFYISDGVMLSQILVVFALLLQFKLKRDLAVALHDSFIHRHTAFIGIRKL